MARIKKREMSKHFTILFLFFQTLCQICHSLETVESHNQAFIQTDKHLTYIVGDVDSGIPIEVKAGQVYNDFVGREDILLPNAIQLEPAMLDFQEQPVGMPRMEHVTVHNTDGKNNLHLLSISGSTAHFHCSFFQDKIVPPGGNTTFDVVFLARQEGNVENTLYIHTSLGSFKYQVFGVGTANPYRLRPYLGARVPVNSSFAPLINMHNPHSTTLQVLEIFSSEGDLHLELPTGEKEAPRSLWEIPPYETKTIMKANFVGRTENNHTAFIRIKTNHKPEKQLILPMEVEVTSSPGVYVASELIDFGIVRTFDEPRTVPVNLVNTGDSLVHISSVSVYPPNEAISIDFRPVKLQPEFPRQTTVAYITFRASKAIHPKFWSGKIIVKSKNNLHRIAIPYEAKVLHGSLTYDKNSSYFLAHNHPTNYSRLMMFTNTFNFSLVLFNVTLPPDMKDIFTVLNFSKPVMLPPQKLITPFILKFHPSVAMMHFRTILSLRTNASVFEIELIVYNGQLKIIPHRPEKLEGQLDFGTMGVRENKSVLFTLVNDNPIELYLHEYSTDMKGATLEVIGIEKGNGTTLTQQHNMSAINTNPLVIWPYHFAVFSLNLVAPEEEGQYQAEVIITTMYQDTFMPVTVRTSEGSLHAIPERIVFDKVFPGKVPMKVLQVHSTFHDYMGLKSVSFQPADHRFYFISARDESLEQITGDKLVLLEPQTNNTIGKIFYDSKRECREECYVGLSTHTPAGQRWVQGLQLEKDTAETDEYLYNHFRQRWRSIQEQGKDRANVTIEIDTTTVQGFLFSAHVQHHWPDVIRKSRSRIRFPLTQIGNTSKLDIMVENLGDIPIIVQVLPLHLYPNPQTIVDLLKHDLPSHFSEYMETEDPDIFTLSELKILKNKPDSALNKFRKFVDETLGVHSHKDSISIYMEKAARFKVQIGFAPKDDSLKSTMILVRNNLTIIDAIVLEGQGGRGELKLNNRKPGVSSLQFDIAEKHLKNCEKKKHAKNMIPNFTVRRSFTLRNTGELPFYVHGYSINSAPCEGYGFRVLACEGFEMKPNSTKKIDIAFTPDFTMSRIQRTLTIYTSLGQAFNYTLQATVPPHTLSKCAASLPRPNWEPVLYYSIVCVMGFILFCILVASYFEADRIFVADILKRKVKLCNGGAPPYNKEQIFDLKAIGITQNGTGGAPNTPPAKTSPPPIPAHLINKIPRPPLDLSNGHIEHKTREATFWSSVASTFKSMFMRKTSSSKKRIENNNSVNAMPVLKPSPVSTPVTTTPSSNQSDREKPVTPETMIPEKSNPTYAQSSQPQKVTLRKNKAAKRSVTDSTPNVDSSNTSSERKQSTKSNHTSVAEKRATDTSNTVKDMTTSPNMTIQDSSGLATFDEIRIPDKSSRGKKKLRSKPDRDSVIRERLLQRQLEDRDETSSTSTESSNGDIESISTRTGSPEPIVVAPPKPKRKSKSRASLEPLIIAQPDDDTEDFEITSKSRAYKRIRGQYGGELPLKTDMKDISLPYNIEKTKMKKKKASPVTKDINKGSTSKRGAMHELDHLDDIAMETRFSESDSPAPSWDEPRPALDDFSELSMQTDQFVQRQTNPGSDPAVLSPLVGATSPDGLTNSSRSSSYSSIVSSSSGGDANGKGKGDNKRYPAGFTPLDSAQGSLLTKTPPATSASKRNAWGAVPSPTTTDIGGFGLQTIQEDSRPGNTLTNTVASGFNQPAFPFDLGVSSSNEAGYGFTPETAGFGSQDANLTMMQRLQMDRRRRVMEHQTRLLNGGEEWPGFDIPLTRNESLWDSEYTPLGDAENTWTMAPDEVPTTSSSSIWSSLSNSANSSWNSLMGIWGRNTATSQASDPLTPGSMYAPNTSAGQPIPAQMGAQMGAGIPAQQMPAMTPGGTQDVDSMPVFDPFSSPIWRPSASTASSGWDLPPPPGTPNSPVDTKDN